MDAELQIKIAMGTAPAAAAAAAAARVVPAALHVLRLPAAGLPEHGSWGDCWLLVDPAAEVAAGDLLHFEDTST